MQILATEEIAKSYRGRRVVNGVSLRINQAEVVGLLGPNGAGKTTTFYMIVGLTPPDSGREVGNCRHRNPQLCGKFLRETLGLFCARVIGEHSLEPTHPRDCNRLYTALVAATTDCQNPRIRSCQVFRRHRSRCCGPQGRDFS